ncbi:MAG: hypothetical protein II000_02330 [Clostridia bacterium]|nr:hypothetical protein [Clostridia bacterium]
MDQNISVCRFRDNKELMYSLRSVEKYAPWIRNIFIVSNSSMPAWLNTDHPKLHIISHETIMPADSLPCFNSYVIESYLHRIPGLSEIFLYANDDMFFGNHVSPDFFIKHGILKACFPIDLLYDKPLYELFFTRTGKDAEKRKERSKCLRSASSSRSIKSSHISVNVWTACWRRRLPILN